MLCKTLTHIPTNLVMGFLGVGKTTAVIDLLRQKPDKENWAVLVNEFGKIGIDGAIYQENGVKVKEIAGGCLCCAVGLPFQVSVNRLLKQVRPDRLLIEPTGLGHPKKVLDMLLADSFKEVLDVRASLCLVDPEKLKDSRYTTHQNFIDQITLSDVLVANKMDLADNESVSLFNQWAKNCEPEKAMIAYTQHGRLDANWLDIKRDIERRAMYPQAHKITQISKLKKNKQSSSHQADGYQSFGHVFSAQHCFNLKLLKSLFSQLQLIRIKGILNTDQGYYVINGTDSEICYSQSKVLESNQLEIISRQEYVIDIPALLDQCLMKSSESLENNEK